MKITFEKPELAEALKILLPVVNARSSLPILGSLKFETIEPEQVKVTATNQEQTVSALVVCDTEAGGEAFTIPGQKIGAILANADTHQIGLEPLSPSKVQVQVGTSSFELETLHAEGFPAQEEITFDHSVQLDSIDLHRILVQVKHAASSDESRAILCGVCLGIGEGRVTATATDGRRLASAHIDHAPADDAVACVLPSAAVSEICKIIASAEEPGLVQCHLSGDCFKLTFNGIEFSTKLISGNYPNWRQVVPSDAKHTASLGRADLLGKVNQCRIMASTDAPCIKLLFSEAGVNLQAEAAEIGRAEGLMQFGGSFSLQTACSPQFLAEALKASAEDETEFGLSDELSPITLKNAGLVQVIMPIRGN